MANYVWPFTTPISRTADLENGIAWGTGNYIAFEGSVYVLTNEHVARQMLKEPLAHLPKVGDYYVRFENDFEALPWPDDIALSKLGEHGTPDQKRVIHLSQFESKFNPEEHELLFWLGYPGTTGKRSDVIAGKERMSYFGELVTPSFPILSQQYDGWPLGLREAYLPEHHRLIHYPRVAKQNPGEAVVEVPNPAGMSGSLVWDTKRIYCERRGLEWSPQKSRVCGLIWATDLDPDIVVATPSEAVLAAIDALPSRSD